MEKMNQALIENWNRTVSAQDEIYILGDVTMKGPELAEEALSQLKGHKYLIKGNHDRFVKNENFNNSLFEWIKDYYELSYENNKFILFHYPIEEWNGYFRGTIHLHGHQHNHENYNFENLEKNLKRFDVGVDANYMRPVSIEDIIAFFSIEK
jgi:Predicted phosphoesterase or phosphohydrolase